MLNDSLDKVIGSYFSVVNAAPFTYKRKTYDPRPLRVSPALARGLICPPQCAGCCPRFSLDYLPFEDVPYALPSRQIVVNGKEFAVLSDLQEPGWHCKNVDMITGRCVVHGKQPFSCDFEIVRTKHFTSANISNQLLTAPFGRAWALKRVDDERGALCEITPVSYQNAQEAARKLRRLARWMEYFEVPHRIDPITLWLERGDYQSGKPLLI